MVRRKLVPLIAGLSVLVLAGVVYIVWYFPSVNIDEAQGTSVSLESDTLINSIEIGKEYSLDEVAETIFSMQHFRDEIVYSEKGGDLNVTLRVLEQFYENGASMYNRGDHIDAAIYTLENVHTRLAPLARMVDFEMTIRLLEQLPVARGIQSGRIEEAIHITRAFRDAEVSGVDAALRETLAAMREFRRNRVWKVSAEIEQTIRFLRAVQEWNPHKDDEDLAAAIRGFNAQSKIESEH